MTGPAEVVDVQLDGRGFGSFGGVCFPRPEYPLDARGEPAMSDSELAVFVSAFESTGFTGSINWYRNLDRNWHLLADVDPIIQQPTLMI